MGDLESTYIIVLAAPEVSEDELRLLARAGAQHPVVAVDAGYAWCWKAGVPVAYAVGDFDSLGYVPESPRTEVHPCKKDKTDFELALELVEGFGAARLLVFAAFGGRPDHALAVEQILARAAESGIAVTAFGPGFALDVLCGPASLGLAAQERGTVSLLAMTDEARGVCIDGLEYPLQDAALSARSSLGVSNEFMGAPARISIEQGTVFVFHSLNYG